MSHLPCGEHSDVWSDSITRLLSDKLYEKRKLGALEIEKLVREALRGTSGSHEVQRILDCLCRQYIESQEQTLKKGGLIGLASVAVGLEKEGVGRYLSQLVTPVAGLFKDEDARVRYYACESLFNISKVAGFEIVDHFNAIFEGVCHLYADTDADVKRGVMVLDQLIKDIVTTSPHKFKTKEFVPLLVKMTQAKNPFIRQLVLSWVHVLLKLEELMLDMVQFLPEYLEGIFDMLEEKQSRDIRHNADTCLEALLKGVKASPDNKKLEIISATAGIVVRCCDSNDSCSACRRLTAVCWLNDFVEMKMAVAAGATGVNDFVEMKMTMAEDAADNERWLRMLPALLGGTLHCIDASEEEIKRIGVKLSNGLLDLAQVLPGEIPVAALMERLLQFMRDRRNCLVVRTVCLQWICMLLVRSREDMLSSHVLNNLFEPIFESLSNSKDDVVAAALAVLARIMEGKKGEEDVVQGPEGRDLFADSTERLLELFRERREMLEVKGGAMIRHLCGNLNSRHLYVTVARFIQHNSHDLEFAQQLVQTFNWILLTAVETKSLRDELLKTRPLSEFDVLDCQAGQTGKAAAARPLFLHLLEPWFFNPVSALALCLWAQQYEFAVEMITRIAVFDPSLDMLRQLDQLVHLLESPVFSGLRLRLLEPRRHPALFKCLLGLAMLLPQAAAFRTLSERIRVVQSGLLLEFQQMEQQQQQQQQQNQPAAGGTKLLAMVMSAGSGGASGGERDAHGFDRLLGKFDEVTASSQESSRGA